MTTRMPITTASRKGISAVATAATTERIVLTNQGRPVAVVDSAERLDDAARTMREAALGVLDWAASKVAADGARLSLDEVCARVGVDPDTVRERARARHAT